jgi:hypothetical protein
MSLRPNHCGWCGGTRRPVLLAMASGRRPTEAAREAGRSRGYAQSCLRGALERGCYAVPPVFPPLTHEELGRASGEARRRSAALREEVRASATRCLVLAREARALAEAAKHCATRILSLG